ncbi:hypothetical protein TIFTF001_036099 [Ficus carica]|uniref:DUF4220 domain-containing protein n=1 Tax=Ficus carica TaxID=3494 RepID=A0AA88E2P8_FICCA|nr:hypothetical protein TIFTF001_036098 [Ficus carica]GMN67037.1 hypothetical protein TIFTF001_036099 [Ficus carica]
MNMISYCLPPTVKFWFSKFNSYRRVYGIRMTIKMILRYSSSSKKVREDLKRFVIGELQKKSRKASNPRDAAEASSQRGNLAFLKSPSSYVKLKWSIRESQYAESLLLWHLATALLCYEQDSKSTCCRSILELLVKLWSLIRTISSWANRHILQKCFHNPGESSTKTSASSKEEPIDYKEICNVLSDYMFYLLVDKPAMLAPVLGNWNVVFQDTRAEAKSFFLKHKLSHHSKACESVFKVKAKVRSVAVKVNRSKSVLFDACILAQQLNEEKAEKWEIMSRVWVELLSYAAISCRPFVHAQQLSKGGELLTFTWLLMNHLGLGTQFADQELQSGTKKLTITE